MKTIYSFFWNFCKVSYSYDSFPQKSGGASSAIRACGSLTACFPIHALKNIESRGSSWPILSNDLENLPKSSGDSPLSSGSVSSII
uniref:Uncharacterized protein n=1 Tax=Leptospirillum ferrodiazotrophum TaxID=412449 RepID=C6HXZ5_9BACT|nr:MAG: hypothetical protein UBAL3_93200108 [Leptospirillum ferrodiazotrophum]